jgi:hypothetical protein
VLRSNLSAEINSSAHLEIPGAIEEEAPIASAGDDLQTNGPFYTAYNAQQSNPPTLEGADQGTKTVEHAGARQHRGPLAMALGTLLASVRAGDLELARAAVDVLEFELLMEPGRPLRLSALRRLIAPPRNDNELADRGTSEKIHATSELRMLGRQHELTLGANGSAYEVLIAYTDTR